MCWRPECLHESVVVLLRRYVPHGVNFNICMYITCPVELNILSRCLFQNYWHVDFYIITSLIYLRQSHKQDYHSSVCIICTISHDIWARHSQYVYSRHWGTPQSIRALTRWGTPQSIRVLTTLGLVTVNTCTHDIGVRQVNTSAHNIRACNSQYVYSRHWGTSQSIRVLTTLGYVTVNTCTHDIGVRHSQYVYSRHWGTSQSIRVLTTSGHVTVNTCTHDIGACNSQHVYSRHWGTSQFSHRVLVCTV